MPSDAPADNLPISVTELNRRAKRLLERGLMGLWIEGEVSNLARPASGHLYFSLKDSGAQVRCAWFRQRQRTRGDQIANGEQVLVYGRVSLYEPRGDYQVIVDRVELAGEGALRRQFERLKRKLSDEGLFDAELKRELPRLPRQIGIVTSPSGAAVRDVISVLGRRFPAVPVVLYPAAVQGAAAAGEIVTALAKATERRECDVLIVGRGGGSLEDLMAFNDEAVARAIHACPIPVISAVGHEVDVTIADFVADCRAPTPSGAAELAVPEQEEWQRALSDSSRRLARSITRHLEENAQTLDWLTRQLATQSPQRRLEQQRLKLGALHTALRAAAQRDILLRMSRLDGAAARLKRASPDVQLRDLRARMLALNHRLPTAARASIDRHHARLRVAARALNAVSPLATLERGYSVTTDRAGHILSAANQVAQGDSINTRLSEGSVEAKVTKVHADSGPGDRDEA
ncbi:MAG: exodeoxyribonuclease VII large subunit [Pseudomonadota bacterium]